jgi:hypothetical protein
MALGGYPWYVPHLLRHIPRTLFFIINQRSGTMKITVWIARGLIGLVFFFNIQCAILFLAYPKSYAPGFELTGEAGSAMMRGIGLLLIMWNVPYAVAFWQPDRHFLSLVESTLMQAIGFIGESLLLLNLPLGHAAIQFSVQRFIFFDGWGFIALLIAFGLVYRLKYFLPRR